MRLLPLLCVVLAAGTLPLGAQTTPTRTPTPAKTPAPTATPAFDPDAPEDNSVRPTPTPKPRPVRTATPTPAKKAAEPVIEGIAIARRDGRWLGVTTLGNQLRISFYDKDKKPENADLVRGLARWDHPRTTNEDRAVLLPSGPGALATPPVVKPPYVYVVRVTLFDANDKASESYTISLKPPATTPPAGASVTPAPVKP